MFRSFEISIPRVFLTAYAAKLIVGILGALLMSMLYATPASACSCVGWTREQYMERASVILRGTVVKIEESSDEGPFGSTVATIDISTIWKGERHESVRVYFGDGSSCGLALDVGVDYILYVLTSRGPDGDPLLSVSRCGPSQTYNEDEARKLGPGIPVGPTPIPSPTVPVCPTSAHPSPTPDPVATVHSSNRWRAFVPLGMRGIVNRASKDSTAAWPCVTATALPTVTPTPFFAEPPTASMNVGESLRTSGIGSYCWWAVSPTCHVAPGVASGRTPRRAQSPVTIRFLLKPEQRPFKLELSTGLVTADDEIRGPSALWSHWNPRQMTTHPISLERVPSVTLSLEPGLHLVRLVAQWGADADAQDALGWVEYGWLLDIYLPPTTISPIAGHRVRTEP